MAWLFSFFPLGKELQGKGWTWEGWEVGTIGVHAMRFLNNQFKNTYPEEKKQKQYIQNHKKLGKIMKNMGNFFLFLFLFSFLSFLFLS